MKNAPNALHAILSIETDGCITCRNLYTAICTAECETCGDFNGYVYILTCRRVYFLCLSEKTVYLPLSYRLAAHKIGVISRIIDTLPYMRSIPGMYSPNEKKNTKRLRSVGLSSARQAGIHLYGSAHAMEQVVSKLAAQTRQQSCAPQRVLGA